MTEAFASMEDVRKAQSKESLGPTVTRLRIALETKLAASVKLA